MEIEMTIEMQVRMLVAGSWITLSIEQARELRDFLMSEPSITPKLGSVPKPSRRARSMRFARRYRR